MKTYLLPINIEPDDGGTWYAEVPIIPGCALSCYPLEHVLESIQEAAQMMLEAMVEYGDPLPEGIESYEVIPGGNDFADAEVVIVEI